MRTNLHFPSGVPRHPLGVNADCLFKIAIESDRAEVHSVGEKGVPEQILDTIEGVAIEQKHRLLRGMSSKGNFLELPLWDTRQDLNMTL